MENTWKTPAPLFEDPVYGGPTDPCVIWNEENKEWWMFYTQRRANSHHVGVSGIHGTDIGIAVSKDGAEWLYRGTAEGLEIEWGRNTFWAPEVIRADGVYHMFVSYIRGVPTGWTGKASIIHYISDNLWKWRFSDILNLDSDRVIDACAVSLPEGGYKLWYKDERRGSHTCAAVSPDLKNWALRGAEITDCQHEGPNVFLLGGYIWMITDTWDGLSVYRSDDYIHWVRQEGRILRDPGMRHLDCTVGNHADVVVAGEYGYIFYFVHPDYPAEQRDGLFRNTGKKEHHTVIQCARLSVENGKLICDRDEDFDIREMVCGADD